MALNERARQLLDELATADPTYTLFGLLVNPETDEIGTFCSQPFPPGQVLGFLQQGVTAMVQAAADGQLEGEANGEYHTAGTGTQGSIEDRAITTGVHLVH